MAVIDLPTAKAYLKLDVTATTYNAVLPIYIAGAEAAIAQWCGPLEPTPLVRRVTRVGREGISLPVTPAIELTSVTPVGGTAIDLTTLELDLDAGVITYLDGRSFGSGFGDYPYGAGYSTGYGSTLYDVEYVAGRETCPDDLKLAALEMLKEVWSSAQRGSGGKPGTGKSDHASNTVPGAGDKLPFNVDRLITPHRQIAFA